MNIFKTIFDHGRLHLFIFLAAAGAWTFVSSTAVSAGWFVLIVPVCIYALISIIAEACILNGFPMFYRANKLVKMIFDTIPPFQGTFEQKGKMGHPGSYRYDWKWESPETHRTIHIRMECEYSIQSNNTYIYEVVIDGKKIDVNPATADEIWDFFARGATLDKNKHLNMVQSTLDSMLQESYREREEALQKEMDSLKSKMAQNEFRGNGFVKETARNGLTS